MEKVIDIEERIPSMREKRRRRTNKKFLFVLIIFAVALFVILYFQSPLSRIKEIAISGATLHDQVYYQKQSGLEVDKPLWGFNKNSVINSLSELDAVKKVSVSRKWINDIKITISEWGPIAYIEDRGQFSLLMENGELLQTETMLLDTEIPLLNGFDDINARKKMSTQLLELDPNVYHLISEILFTGTEVDMEKVTVYMDDGFEVRGIISTFSEKMDFYPEITAQLNGIEKGVIDMEVGTYFTPYSDMYNPIEEDDEVVEEDE